MRGKVIIYAIFLPLFACSGISQLTAVCVRYVDEEGYLRGRNAVFNTHGAKEVIRIHKWSYLGNCVKGEQGPPRRIYVCLVRSSKCAHDRTTTIFEDEWEKYKERYPGSYKGECKEEKPDECGKINAYPSSKYKPKCVSYDKLCKP